MRYDQISLRVRLRPRRLRHGSMAACALLGIAVSLATPGLAWAVDEAGATGEEATEGETGLDAIEESMMESVTTEEPAAVEKKKELPEVGEDILELFVLDRGFYVASDLGIFFTFGGVRGYSNVQPYLSIMPGFDIGEYFGIQLDISLAYASGNAISNADRKLGDPKGIGNYDATADYGLFNVGVEVVAALRPTARFAIEPKLGGGFTFIDPPLTDPSSVPGAANKVDGSGGHFIVGADFKYLTLLTNFTAGASVNFIGFVGAWGFIPALSVTAVVRYTFWAM